MCCAVCMTACVLLASHSLSVVSSSLALTGNIPGLIQGLGVRGGGGVNKIRVLYSKYFGNDL